MRSTAASRDICVAQRAASLRKCVRRATTGTDADPRLRGRRRARAPRRCKLVFALAAATPPRAGAVISDARASLGRRRSVRPRPAQACNRPRSSGPHVIREKRLVRTHSYCVRDCCRGRRWSRALSRHTHVLSWLSDSGAGATRAPRRSFSLRPRAKATRRPRHAMCCHPRARVRARLLSHTASASFLTCLLDLRRSQKVWSARKCSECSSPCP